MGKEGMRKIVTIDPDPTYRKAAANIRKEERAMEQKKQALKAIRTILAAKHMLKNHGFEFVGQIMIRDQVSGKKYREGAMR